MVRDEDGRRIGLHAQALHVVDLVECIVCIYTTAAVVRCRSSAVLAAMQQQSVGERAVYHCMRMMCLYQQLEGCTVDVVHPCTIAWYLVCSICCTKKEAQAPGVSLYVSA